MVMIMMVMFYESDLILLYITSTVKEVTFSFYTRKIYLCVTFANMDDIISLGQKVSNTLRNIKSARCQLTEQCMHQGQRQCETAGSRLRTPRYTVYTCTGWYQM